MEIYMKYYVVANIMEVKDDSWVPEYMEKVTKLVEQNGGKYLARTPQVERLEGDQTMPHLAVIMEFPSKEAAHTFYTSEEYSPYLENRKAGAVSQLTLVAGEDIAKG